MSKLLSASAVVAFVGFLSAFSGWSVREFAPGESSAALPPPTTAPHFGGSRAHGARRAHRVGGEPLAIARIYFEYNSSANDLGVHVMLDGEDWKSLEIKNPTNQTIFDVKGKQAYAELGMTELFFEGAEPNLSEVPLADLLAKFPEGPYAFQAKTVGGGTQNGTGTITHAIPAGPVVNAQVGPGNQLVIGWTQVIGPPSGFPNRPIVISGYQVIVDSFQVTLPASATSVTVPPEFVASLAPGPQPFEVLAIEVGGNQTITEGTFMH